MPNVIEEKGFVSTVRLHEDAAVTLSNDFSGYISDPVRISPLGQTELLLDYTMGSGESGNTSTVKVELSESEDGPWREMSIGADGAPASGVVETTLYSRRYLIEGEQAGVPTSRWYAFPTSARYLRLSAMEEGVAVNPGTLTAKLRMSNVLRTS